MELKSFMKPVKFKKAEIHLWTFLLFALGMLFDFFDILIISYAITAIHETAHIITAKMCGVETDVVEVLPFGITMRIAKNCIADTWSEIKIASAGPASNFLIAYFIYGFYNGVYKEFIITASLAMGAFNILPVLPLDGGRILRALLVKKMGHIRAASAAIFVSNFMAVLIFAAGIYTLYVTGFNFSFLLIGAFLTANLTEERKNANMIIMKDILYSRKKLLDKGISRTDTLVAEQNEKAKKVLKMISYDRYYLINIVDNHMRVVKTVTETEVIEAMAVYGMNIPMKKIVEIRL